MTMDSAGLRLAAKYGAQALTKSRLAARAGGCVAGRLLREIGAIWRRIVCKSRQKRDGWLVAAPLSPYEAWLAVNRLSEADKRELREALEKRSGRLPKISLITPVYNTDPSWLNELVASVSAQIYENWELCLADDCSSAPHVGPLLVEIAARDPRIKVTRLGVNGGISAATNAAVAIATGEVIAFLDHDDLITPDCLGELAIYYADQQDADMVYSDDDKIDLERRRYAPQFKPDWAPILLLSFMYMSHMFSVRRSLFLELGGFRTEYDGSQDYDFALRAAEVARHVGHVPKILYHWRAAPGSTAASADAKPASLEAGRRAVEQAMRRRGFNAARVIHPDWADAGRVGMFEIEFPDNGPSVCIIIPTKNQLGYLQSCIRSLALTTYRNYEVLVADNESDSPDALTYLEAIQKDPRIRVVRIGNPTGRFNFAALNNAAVRHSDAEFVLFLNDDTEVISPRWLSQMMGYARMARVGAVGARLYFEDGAIQHAGIVHGYYEGSVGHAFRYLPRHDWGYMGFVRAAREYSGVTAACMLTPRALFQEIGGFDEDNFALAYNDVDYCYRLVKMGRSCIYCPTAELYHFEGKSRGFVDDPQERVNFRRLYGDWYERWYNPNLSLDDERFRLMAVRAATRRSDRVRVLFISHNLNNEGISTTLLELVVGLVTCGAVTATVLSPSDGPLRSRYEATGIAVHVLGRSPWLGVDDEATLAVALARLGEQFKALAVEVVVANTLQSFWAVAAAFKANIPALWCQYECDPWQTYFDFLPEPVRRAAYGAFSQAYRVVCAANATRWIWRELETRSNFQVIHHGIPQAGLAEAMGRWSRAEARAQLGVTEGETVVESVGAICPRNGQMDMVLALALLPKELQSRLRVFLVGRIDDADYSAALAARIAKLPEPMAGRVMMTGFVENPFLYYSAADISVCSARTGAAPRVLIEAMACSLPIITTPVFGIPEIVCNDVNALFYAPGDVRGLADRIKLLATDNAFRNRLGAKSRTVLEGQPGFVEAVTGYARLIRQAVNLRIDDDGITDSVSPLAAEISTAG